MFCDIGSTIKVLRQANNDTQQSLADRMNVPRVWISKIECWELIPTIESICRLAEALHVPVCILITIATCDTKEV